MKKTITNPDGSTEVVEGTAEEIAEYERKRKTESASPPPSKKRRVLNEETVRAIAKEEAEKVRPVVINHGVCTCPVCCPFKPYWIVPVGCQHEYPSPWLGVIPPACIKCGEQAAPWYTITVAGTADLPANPSYGVISSGYVQTNEMRPEYNSNTLLVQN